MDVGKDIANGSTRSDHTSDESDEELGQAVGKLSKVGLASAWSDHSGDGVQPLIEDTQSASSDYSTTVIRQPQAHNLPSLSSVLTIRPTGNGNDGAGGDIATRNATSAFSQETFQTAHS